VAPDAGVSGVERRSFPRPGIDGAERGASTRRSIALREMMQRPGQRHGTIRHLRIIPSIGGKGSPARLRRRRRRRPMSTTEGGATGILSRQKGYAVFLD